MLVRRDLGFLAGIAVVVTVIWFVIRRKWRIAAARREEIKRLLVFAAEESARAEFEAKVFYETAKEEVVSEKLPVLRNECALCFSPAAKFCSQCKAVRYCSGKCQIIHWRQGHKQECRPYTIFNKGNEGKFSSQKEFNQKEYASYGDNYELEKRQYAKQVETFPQNYTDVGNSDLLHRKDDIEGKGLTDDVESNSSATSHLSEGSSELTNTSSEASLDASVYSLNDSDGLNKIQTATGISVKSETACMNMDKDRSSFTERSSNLKKTSIKSSHYNSICSDGDSQNFCCSSSGWSVDGSVDSLSEPSTTSSGFWEGTINSRRSRNGANDDGTQSSSSDSGGDLISDPVSSPGTSADLAKNITPAMPQQGCNSNTMISDDLSASRTKRHVSEAASSVKISGDSLKSMKSTSLNIETSISMQVDTGYNSRVLKSKETKSSSSNNHCARPYVNDQGNSPMKDVKNINNSPSLCSERSKVGKDTISSSLSSDSQEVGAILCKDSDLRSASSSGRDAGQTANLSKVGDSVHGVTAGSSKLPTDSVTARTGLKSTMLKVVDQLKPSKISKHYATGLGGETLGNYIVKGLFSYELFVKLYNWNQVDMQPFGLINCGNSCYANAVLQCLAFTPPITAYLLQRLHSKTCQNKDWCFACEFENLVVKAKEGNTPLSPIRILSHIENIGSHLDYGREEDAHEFLRCAIDTLQSSCLKEAAPKGPGSLNEETTLMGLTFGGYLRSKIKCMRCGGKSERNDRIMDLTVEIDGNICTLEEALRKFTSTEILDGENKYNCSRNNSSNSQPFVVGRVRRATLYG